MPTINPSLTTQKIKDMKAKGLTNNQIIQTMQRDGYKTSEIFDALNEASIQTTTPGTRENNINNNQTYNKIGNSTTPLNNSPNNNSNMNNINNANNNFNTINNKGMSMPPPTGLSSQRLPPITTNQPMNSMTNSSDEEIIEAIIDEKWNDLVQDINKIISWKEKTEQKIYTFEESIKDLKDRFDKLHAAVIGKVGEYDQHILQIGAEIKAMEKVFSKVLPVFTSNVAELSRVTTIITKNNDNSNRVKKSIKK